MATTIAFIPSVAQRRLLDYVHENPGYQPTRDLCRSANVPRATYYRWCRNPAFRQWLGSAWASRLLFDGITLLNIARAQAPEKFSYWKALFEITFDPKGLGLLAQWAASLAPLAPDAFQPAPQPPRVGPAATAQDGGFHIPRMLTIEEWNQHIAADRETLSRPSPTPANASPCGPAERPTDRSINPVQTIKVLSRAFTKIRTTLAGSQSPRVQHRRPALVTEKMLPNTAA